jgi:hypothetical protein
MRSEPKSSMFLKGALGLGSLLSFFQFCLSPCLCASVVRRSVFSQLMKGGEPVRLALRRARAQRRASGEPREPGVGWRYLAEVSRNRTDRSTSGRPTGFEVLGEHQPACTSALILKNFIVLVNFAAVSYSGSYSSLLHFRGNCLQSLREEQFSSRSEASHALQQRRRSRSS